MLCRIALLSLLAGVYISAASAESASCGAHERPNPTGKCIITCNACRDCGPCTCKTGYIRQSMNDECISEPRCHELHSEWMKAIKYHPERDYLKFFNCKQNKTKSEEKQEGS